jgi:nicotinate-nucleotide adenylyltransferase
LANIGVFCGTFNPIHLGHLLMAECARDQGRLEKVIFVTSPRPPHRSDPLLDALERHHMVKVALAGNRYFEASDLEISRSGPSYTIDTIEQLLLQFGAKTRLHLLLGADNFRQLASWHRAEQICALTKIMVAPRSVRDDALSNGINEEEEHWQSKEAGAGNTLKAADVTIIDFPMVNISSSLIRKRLCQGQSVLYMVPQAVNEVLLSKRHYVDPAFLSEAEPS